ncbi:unannotated protein [freshwater metagenome]|uniref:Unannotated protein n=1 Tax=freshwater metagenome TaxID=449393 RepID=A0A6J6QZ06_9ZZZZ
MVMCEAIPSHDAAAALAVAPAPIITTFPEISAP